MQNPTPTPNHALVASSRDSTRPSARAIDPGVGWPPPDASDRPDAIAGVDHGSSASRGGRRLSLKPPAAHRTAKRTQTPAPAPEPAPVIIHTNAATPASPIRNGPRRRT